MANMVVFEGMLRQVNKGLPKGEPMRRMRAVMNNDLIAGGHLSSQFMGALYNAVDLDEAGKPRVVSLPPREDNPYRCDEARAVELLEKTRPDLVVFGKSMFLFREPVAAIREAGRPPRPAAAAHVRHGARPRAVRRLPGPPGGGRRRRHRLHAQDVLRQPARRGRRQPRQGPPAQGLWADVQARAFPGHTSNHHLGTLLGLLLATMEMNLFRDEYQRRVRSNARAFALALAREGVRVEGEKDGYTETHQVVFRVPEKGTANRVARHLEEQGIICNFQALPDDETFTAASGIRTGVQEMTRFGMDEPELREVAALVARAIRGEKVKDDVRDLRGRFVTMRYCLPADKAAALAARVLDSTMASSELTQALRRALG